MFPCQSKWYINYCTYIYTKKKDMFEMQLLEMPNKNLTVILKILKKKSPSSLIFFNRNIYIQRVSIVY